MSQPLSPGATIGILGGGQLGRMLALAAAPLGLNCHVYCPDETSPAFDVCSRFTCAPYEDTEALDVFAASVDVVTYEFENVPDITAAIQSQNVLVPAGQIGGEPAPPGTEFTYTVDTGGRFETPEEFGAVVVRSNPDGSQVKLKAAQSSAFCTFCDCNNVLG